MDRTMIVDHRTYTIKPSGILGWLALYYEKGWPLQQKYLGNCLGFYLVKEGRQDQVVHLWAYQSQADREARAVMRFMPTPRGRTICARSWPWTSW
jgi:hypothetical protein